MNIFTKKKTIAVHSGTFHSDDVFACATLSILLEGNITIIRTRDESIIKDADYVVDVGGEYDPERNRFDHHQIGGAGARSNGIPYASFGLVWKHFGEILCGSRAAAEKIDASIVAPIDGPDNGVAVYTPAFPDVGVFGIHNVVASFIPTWKEKDMDVDAQFEKAVVLAKQLLEREIKRANDAVEATVKVEEAYETAHDKRLLVLDENYPYGDVVRVHPEVLFVVSPTGAEGNWGIKAVKETEQSFKNRKDLPAPWAGLRDAELQKVTGVPEAIFCHTKLFLAVARTKKSALALAGLALNRNIY
jgi:uncharacterized UPF0160 family protein